MGLLDSMDSDQFRLGLGLLAAGSARGDGAGFGKRLLEGVGYMDNYKSDKKKAEFEQMKVDEYKRKVKQEEDNRLALQQAFSPMTGGQAMANGQGPTLGNAANIGQMQKFDPRTFFQKNPNADMSTFKTAMEANLLMNPTPKYESYGPDSSVYEMTPNGPKLALTTPGKPKDDKPDAKIAQFEYAKANGYKGSFEQFVTLGPSIMAGAMAPLRAAQIGNIVDENAYNLPPPRRAQGGGVSVTAGGRTYNFPDQKSANNFKLKAGIR